MSLAGPRLDRPSAIGDEGRPRAASLWIASLIVVAIVGVVGLEIGESSLLPTLGLVVGLSVAGVGLLERDGFVSQVVAHGFLMTFGTAFALVVLAAPFVTRAGLAASGCALALAGIGAAWADVGGDELKPAAVGTVIGYVTMLCSAILVTVLIGIVLFGWSVLTTITGVSTPVASVMGFFLILAGTGGVVRLALRWLPVRQLTPRDRRPEIERRLAALRRRLLYTVVGSIGGLVGTALLVIVAPSGLIAGVPLLASALGALSSPVVVWPIVAVGGIALLAGIGAVLLRRMSKEVTARTTRRSAAIVVGVALSVPFLLGLFLFVAGIGAASGAFVIGAALVVGLLLGPLAVAFVLGSAVVGVALGVLPRRAMGPTIAALGLVVAAIGVGRGNPLVVFACIAGAIVVWDSATYGLGLTAELGHLPETRRLELFHGAVTVGLAVASVVVVTALELLRAGLFAGGGATGGVVLVVVGALLLLIPLRG
ncbi:DUF7519 family protein [Natrinema salsiterrestre]|uniref:Uncharacterized protein n=1 Tax=Natrinema salsiterrestre TaxID=2950540 RepID=A0A9Q4L454_9EURY|nr:hypothetical protein [Natrinema salsiterrestre]MDF9744986.1 hypothetical protein [Natrinema salsiterrestre]